jgi:DNA polymerase
MLKLKLDTETYCEADIKQIGGFAYTAHPTTKLICLSYQIDDSPVACWDARTEDPPEDFVNALSQVSLGQGYAYAFNATFDLRILRHIVSRQWELPEVPLERWRDVQAICARFKVPQSLRNAAVALKCDHKKLVTGSALVRKCCTAGGPTPTEQDFQELMLYCNRDVEVMSEIMSRLPVDYLTPMEQEVWQMTYEMNDRGVPVDRTEIRAIIKYLKIYMEGQVKILPQLTKGLVSTPGQLQKIKQFCKDKGVDLPNLQAETVEETLERTDIPEVVKEVLKLRQELSQSSTKKFITLDQMYNNGVVQGNLNYHGAGTGRWAGRGFQYHNLPRAKVEDPDAVITNFINRDIIDDPVSKAKAVIRSMIKAPEGKCLIVSDYSSIENRVLAWLAHDTETLGGFRNNFDQYKDMASFVFNKDYDDIIGPERQLGKALVLGCGYGMSSYRFVVAAKTFGIIQTPEQAKFAVDAYRKKYDKVVRMWYALSDTVKRALRFPGQSYSTNRCECVVKKDKQGFVWLRIVLPSGRALMYMNPRITEGKYGPTVVYRGVNPTTYKFSDKELTPGLLAENVTQASARDILCEGMLNIHKNYPEFELVLCVHDEAGALISEDIANPETLELFNQQLCCYREYRKDLPLAAEGYIARRYRKG